jgi:hypothetical protein
MGGARRANPPMPRATASGRMLFWLESDCRSLALSAISTVSITSWLSSRTARISIGELAWPVMPMCLTQIRRSGFRPV